MKRVLVRYRVKPDRADEKQAFTQDIAERCDEPPVAMGMAEIGSYRFLGE